MKKLVFLLLLFTTLKALPQSVSPLEYREDFDFFWKKICDNYCYFDKKHVDWDRVKKIYEAQISTINSRDTFITMIEHAFGELYDHHCSLRTNTRYSRRLVPTSADCWAAYQNGKPLMVEVRKGFGAEKAGVKAGMEIIAVNDVPVNDAIRPFLSQTINQESKSFALRLLLAGDHFTSRKLTLLTQHGPADFFPDRDSLMLENIQYPAMVESRTYGAIAYMRINNFLFDNALIPKFDSVLNTLLNNKALIIDLRETPSGGNTSVARAILGRFIAKEQFYQKHELYAEEKETGIKRSWEEIVSPRGQQYKGRVVVLADHWTGSIAEGITIAFDGMKRATVIGTELARLNGAVDGFQMPHTGIGFNFPTERLYHLSGLPRELYRPAIVVDVSQQSPGNDLILNAAFTFLKNKTN